MTSLQEQVVLVTGCSTGIGRALAREVRARGHRPFATARRLEAIEDLASEGIETVRLDVKDTASIAAAVQAIIDRAGRIDVLVNNAGVMHRSDILHFQSAEFEEMRAVNVGGTIHCVAAVLPAMKERKAGSIVNLASIAAIGTAKPGTTFYAATKAAVAILTKRFALELGPQGIRVNCVAPGFIMTDMVRVGHTEQELEAVIAQMGSLTMLGRVGRPEDIASVVAFLASDDAGFMTGQIVTADGGRMDYLTHGL